MVFRLWSPAKDSEGRAVSRNAVQHPGVLALIEDAAATKRGVFQSTGDQLFVSGLKKAPDALVIARQIQLGLQGFRGRPNTHPVAVSIAIDSSSEGTAKPQRDQNADANLATLPGVPPASLGKAVEPSHDLLTLLKLAKPAQVLITPDVWQRLEGIRGLPLKSFPGRFGVYEYLWTPEEKLELLQSEPQLTLAALPAAPANVPDSKPGQGEAIAAVAGPPRLESPAAEEARMGAAEGKAERLWLQRPVLVAGIALAVVCTLAFAGVRMFHGSSSGEVKPNAPVPLQQSSPATPTASVKPAQSPAGPPVESHSTANVSLASTARTKAPKQAATQAPAHAQEKPSPPPAPSPECAFAADTTRLAGLAEQYRERGDYTNAERIFRQVLSCDPNNAAAREGLNRAIQGEQESRSRH